MEQAIIVLLAVLGALIALPIVALVRANEAAKRIQRLEQEVRDLQRVLRGQAPTEPIPAEQEPEPERATWERLRRLQAELRPAPVSEPESPTEPESEAPPISVTEEAERSPEVPSTPSPAGDQWEVIVGGSIFNRIGAIALIIGVAFLLKYAFDHNWITPWMRVLMGFVAGAAVLVVGDYFHRKEMRTFAQGVTGAGIAILYLSSYASLNMYHLVSQMVALTLMSAVTITAILLSLRYDAIVVTLFGLFGGFLTPVLLSGGQGSGNGFGLFSYIALLDVGLLVVALRKDSWPAIETLTLAGTYLTYVIWLGEYYTGGQIALLATFLTIYWALFYLVDVYRTARSSATYPELRVIIAGLNAVFYYLALYNLINPEHHKWMGLITLAIGVVYLVTVLAFIRRPSCRLLVPRYTVTAIVFLVVATAVQFTGFRLVTLWAAEAALLVACGVHWRMRYVWASSVGLLAITAVTLVSNDQAFGYISLETFRIVLNERFLAYVVLAGALAVSAVLIRKTGDAAVEVIATGMDYLWPAALLTAFTVDINDLFEKLAYARQTAVFGLEVETARSMIMAIVWAVYSLPLIRLGLRSRLRPLLHLGIAVLAGAGLIAAFSGAEFRPLSSFSVLLNFRAAAFLIVIAVALVEYRWLAKTRERHEWIENALILMQIGVAVLGFELITVETSDCFRPLKDAHSPWLTGLDPSLAAALMHAGLWSAYSVLLGRLGRSRNALALTVMGLLSLGLAVSAVALTGCRFEPIAHFVPLLNLRVAAFLVVFAAAVIHQSWLREGPEASRQFRGIVQVIASLLIFELLSVEVWDYFARLMDVSPESRFESLRQIRQMAVSVTWLIYSIGLMVYGIARRSKTLRIVALTLFEVTILKVFLYDLSSLETLYRIFSFIGLGLILLATSYLYQRYKWLITGLPNE